ncbi:MAG: hypothetical protein ACLTEE_03010 [Anaerobutyricum hallii]
MKNIQIWDYRRLNDKLRHDEDIQVNDKRITSVFAEKTDPVNLKEPL